MVIDESDLARINYWYVATSSQCAAVVDTVHINMGTNKVEIPFKFTRFKSFSFIEPIRDYGFVFTPAIEYIELRLFLTKRIRKLYFNPQVLYSLDTLPII